MTFLKQMVYKKSWSILPKLDAIFPLSTATGRFAHDGAEVDNVGDSIGESDLGSTSSVAAGVSNSKYLVIVSPDHWNLSPTCVEVRPVTQVYRKMASCSSKVTFFELLCPILRSVMTSSLNTGSSTPSSVQMHLGCREVALEPKLHQTIWMCDKAAFRLIARYQLSTLWLERRG